jgi:hypothetical protein
LVRVSVIITYTFILEIVGLWILFVLVVVVICV